MLLGAASAAPSGPDLNTIYILVVILTSLLGTGILTGAIAALRAVKKKGVKDDRIDQTIAEVPKLGDRLDSQGRSLARIEAALGPNGGRSLADGVLRIEGTLKLVSTQIDSHGREFAQIRRALDNKVDK